MTYAVLIRRPHLDLFVGEQAAPPPGYRKVSPSSFRRAWRLRDGVKAFGLWPMNPYEADR